MLIAKPGLDGHDVGAKLVCRALMDAGMDAIYSGLRQTPESVVETAARERVDVIGLSILSGAHMPLCREVARLLRERGLGNLLWIVGGNIPASDEGALQELGVHGIFPTDVPFAAIATFIRESITARIEERGRS